MPSRQVVLEEHSAQMGVGNTPLSPNPDLHMQGIGCKKSHQIYSVSLGPPKSAI